MSSSPNALLIAVGSYACERHFPETIDALIKENFYYVPEKHRLLFELKVYALNFKIEDIEKIVKLMEKIKSVFKPNFEPVFGGDINTLMYFAKVLGVFSILRSVEPSELDLMTLLHFRNTVDIYFPERYVSGNEENVKLYATMRSIFLKISVNHLVLKQFCINELENRWKKFEEKFCGTADFFVKRGFQHLEEWNNAVIEGLKIHEHPWWKKFQQHYSTQQGQDSDETYKTFVDFVKDKIAKQHRKTFGSKRIPQHLQQNE